MGEQETEEGDAASNQGRSEDEDESSQLHDLANSILEECKYTAPLSHIDTAVYLFREALNRRPAPHPLWSDSVKDLAGALLTRFSWTNQHQDLSQAILLYGKMVQELYNVSAGTGGQFQLGVRVMICFGFII